MHLFSKSRNLVSIHFFLSLIPILIPAFCSHQPVFCLQVFLNSSFSRPILWFWDHHLTFLSKLQFSALKMGISQGCREDQLYYFNLRDDYS
jgi:hypothetical protein